ncbi:hypothetical protein L195_g060397 [Trifolium pratense]|uniref:Uncharacterized protein n=1 Tax=Trifolium pratense TaxID=57577 RepID=A0A2K3K3L3_TRIPR|nr:hypothetical protein L195_g060397 [Trifolium pratense]
MVVASSGERVLCGEEDDGIATVEESLDGGEREKMDDDDDDRF